MPDFGALIPRVGASLRSLYLDNCELVSFEGLERLPRLRELTVLNDPRRPLRGLDGLERAAGLERLTLRQCNAAELTPIAALQHLRRLELYEFPRAASLEPLAALTSLEHLTLHGCNRAESLAPLDALGPAAKVNILSYGPAGVTSIRSRRQLAQRIAKLAKAGSTAKKRRKPARKREQAPTRTKRSRAALVFRLEDFSALPELLHMSCTIARGGKGHRKPLEFMADTFVVAAGGAKVPMPAHDPSGPADDEYPPGFVQGLVLCLRDVPGWATASRTRTRGGLREYYGASHSSASLRDPSRWDASDRRAASLCVALGGPEQLLLDIGAHSWESPSRLQAAWIDAAQQAGLSKADAWSQALARELLARFA